LIKHKAPKYLKEILRKYPKIASGRKNFDNYQKRINLTLDLIKKYFKKSNN
tara:strand:+ start:4224 stop:4376 length:153 start_codon:yes stop_codon:yes gene_type:complete